VLLSAEKKDLPLLCKHSAFFKMGSQVVNLVRGRERGLKKILEKDATTFGITLPKCSNAKQAK
jgi:hypothetical protein